MQPHSLIKITLLGVCALPYTSHADQPIMNMMPRWDGGYGFQVRAEHIHRSDLKQGSDVLGRGFTEDISKLHLEGVYTWDRSIRMTFKLPYIVDARREVLDENRNKIVQHDSGIGDLTVALPLKQYFNLAARSGSWTLAPQIRVPLGEKNDGYSVPDRVWGAGAFLGYETETYNWFFATGASFWVFEQVEPTEWSYTVDLGWNARDNMQLLIETDLKWDDDNAFTASTGPALYWRWSDHVHTRIEWKHDVVSRVSTHTPDHGNGDRISVGVGFVF
ncbi:MAG: hypothetical protein ACON4O_08190 [Lentimonas sp.]